MKKIVVKIQEYWKNTEQQAVEWAVLGIILLFAFLTMNYVDILIIADHTFDFLKQIFSGNILNLYDGFYGVYGITPYIIFGVWSLPVWAFRTWMHGALEYTVPIVLWYKLLVAVFIFLSAKKLKEIGEIYGITGSRMKWMLFSFFSSIIFVVPAVITAQIDIIGIYFMLCGLKNYLEGNTKKFLLYFAIAVPMKYFALFIFFPLLLLKEKRIILIGLQTLAAGSIVLISKFLFKGKYLANVNSLAFSYIEDMTVKGSNVAPFIIALGLVCVLAYVIKNSEENIKKYAVYFCFLGYVVYFMFSEWNSYWIILLCPFLILLIFNNVRYLKINLLLEMMAGILIIVKKAYDQPWVFGGGETFSYLFLKNCGGRNINVAYLLDLYHITDLMPIIFSGFLACCTALIIINFPGRVSSGPAGEVKIERGLMWCRLAVLIGWIAVQMVTVFML